MQVDSKPADDYEPTEGDIATMMGFGGFSTTKVWASFIFSVHSSDPEGRVHMSKGTRLVLPRSTNSEHGDNT
jgi:hypothetical protein